jgi:hypothetical protein
MFYDPADRRVDARQIVAGWLICVGLLAIVFGSAPAGDKVMHGIHVVEAAFLAVARDGVARGCLG